MRQRIVMVLSVFALVPAMLIAAPAAAQDAGVGTVTIVHGIPAVEVDVYVDGDATVEGFEYGDVVGPLDLPAADYEVEVRIAGTDTTVLGPEDVTLADGANLTVVAYLDYQPVGASTPQLGVFPNAMNRPGPANARVQVRHLADAPAVDVLSNSDVIADGLENGEEAAVVLPEGVYPASIVDDADNDVVYYEDDLGLDIGYVYALHAVGSTDDDSFQVIVQVEAPFIDSRDNVHARTIAAIAASGITRGCNPPANNLFCPSSTVTRGQMAAFVARALDLDPTDGNAFSDISGHLFEGDINALARANIARGYADGTFRPDQRMTRGQMSAFLNRAFQPGATSTDYFVDDDGNIFENDINAIREAGITRGCNPPANDRYCPHAPVLRSQMASFLSRALGWS